MHEHYIMASTVFNHFLKRIIYIIFSTITLIILSPLFVLLIANLYDHSLCKKYNNTQLNVSVNTDDKSTFSTSLSNEYAYLLYYFENKKDENGNYIYSRFEILQWLDEIRKMGNDQSFAN